MANDALEHRDVAEIDRVGKGLVGTVMTRVALTVRESAEVDRMLEWSGCYVELGRAGRIVYGRMTNRAVVGDNLAGVAEVLAVVTPEAAVGVGVAPGVAHGAGPVAAPAVPAAWAGEMTGGIQDLATGRGHRTDRHHQRIDDDVARWDAEIRRAIVSAILEAF